MALGRLMTAPSEEVARGHAVDARRLLEKAREAAEREAAAREIEERVRSRPGGVWWPDEDGPL